MGAARGEDDLARSHRTMAEGQRMASLVSWAEDPVTGEVVGAEGLTELFGFPPEVVAAGPEAWMSVVHPEDQPALRAQVLPARAHGRQAEYVVRIPDGDPGPHGQAWRWVRGCSRFDVVDGLPRRWGTIQDVTVTRRLEIELEKQVIVNVTSEAVATVANEATTLEEALVALRPIVLADPAWGEVYAHRTAPDGLVTMQVPSLLPEQDPGPEEVALAERAWRSGEVVWNEALTDLAFPLRLAGEVYAVVGLHSDVRTEQQELTTEVARRAATQLERVLERESAEAALAAARDQALAASRAKSDFLAVMSHEIRTPLNAVLGMAELLGASELDADQRRLVQSVRDAGTTLIGLVDDVLDLSRVEAGSLVLENTALDVRETVEKAAVMLGAQARSRGVELTTACAPQVPASLRGDGARLAQIVTNLVSNAVKFTPSGEIDVAVTARDDDGRVRLSVAVRDTGAGIDPVVLDGLFDSFTQADASTTRTHGGSGLGLSIARRLARSMGGDVTAVSRPGRGSTFTAEVVLDRDEPAASEGRSRPTPVLLTGPGERRRRLLSWQLAHHGAEVTALDDDADPVEALRRTRRHGEGDEGDDRATLVVDLPLQATRAEAAVGALLQALPPEVPLVVLAPDSPVVATLLANRPGTARLVKPATTVALGDALDLARSGVENAPEAVRGLAPARAAGELPASGPSRRVLVVEDNDVNQVISRRLLEVLGHTVDIAEDGEEAVRVFDPERHDFVLMDVQMPRMDGYAATRALRARHAGARRTPIVALTAGAVAGVREQCLAAGMDDCLVKPVDLRLLARTVSRWTDGTARGDIAASIAASIPAPSVPVDLAEPSAPPTAMPVLDEGRLAELRMMDEPAWSYLDRTVENIGASAPAAVMAAREAFEAGDTERFRFVVHKLAGSALNIGLREVGEVARAMENDPPGDRADGLKALAALDLAVRRGLVALVAATRVPGPTSG
ncbi:response regulator [Nocardioidaceae bacterium]|nr:response regulator [Nocardioidaceae bacterium]